MPPPSIDLALLDQLLKSTTPLTLDALGRALDHNPINVAARLEGLRAAGCVIDAHPQQGVALRAAGLSCWADYIESGHIGRLGRRLSVYRSISSTQEFARRMVRDAAAPRQHHGHVLVADHQRAGRGRLGRRWLASPGLSLLMTAVVDRRGATADRLMLASCCALARTIEGLTDISVRIRWPNDLLIEDAKVAGILVQILGPTALIGVGLNVSQMDEQPPDSTATSLAAHGPELDRLRILDRLLDELDRDLNHREERELLEAWRRRSALLQQRVTLQSDGQRLTGRVLDLDPTHGLLLDVEQGPVLTLPAATTSLVG